jgi:hypothetical protein
MTRFGLTDLFPAQHEHVDLFKVGEAEMFYPISQLLASQSIDRDSIPLDFRDRMDTGRL